jgi:anion-transporting  ArsA/GET3 family ATPase
VLTCAEMGSHLDDLLSRRLVILTGKGGVGKSVVGSAIASAAADRGKRTLLVEIDQPLDAERSMDAASVGSQETEVRPGLLAMNLDPTEVMDEYVRHVVRIDVLARRVLGSPVYRRFFAAAPGLKELMVLGKLLMLEGARDRWSRRPRYDLIVVDAPATGHGLAYLKVPMAAEAAAPIGPIGANSRRILELLRDPARTALVIVAIPEEMAVVEAAWFHRLAVEEVGIAPRLLVLNGVHERRLTGAQESEVLRMSAEGTTGRVAAGVGLDAALAAARRQIRRRKLSRFYETRLRRDLPLPIVTLPHLYDDPIGPASLRRLADRLEAE